MLRFPTPIFPSSLKFPNRQISSGFNQDMLIFGTILKEIGMNKTLRAVLLSCVVVVLLVVSFGSGFAAGHFIPIGTTATPVTATTGAQGGTP